MLIESTVHLFVLTPDIVQRKVPSSHIFNRVLSTDGVAGISRGTDPDTDYMFE